ncbi:carbon-nitrogen hydrolase family protein [Nocardia arthritidis]|uniref:Hydrolase n=1 Tax=Nocardia arthritidis TaxID=228602 RepID=A0A6G9YFZ9_9NOCA|nr:carbon-nitrogen hydrolase family protein [Nocardia arthritidis]QIS12132.1 hydrolase [Nocardia arthritidis]
MLGRIALAQVNSTADPGENLGVVREYTGRAAAAGARLVVFPEAMMRRFGGNLAAVAEPVDGPWADAVRRIAEEAAVTVVAGMFTPAEDGRVRNTLLITGGGVDTHYDKIHLYDAFGFTESATVAPGEHPVLAEIAGTTVGFATCYDIRFPGLFQRLAADGADLIVVAASWGDGPGKVDQWRLLARARALDATALVAACGQARPATVSNPTAPLGVGHSAVIGSGGTVLAELGPDPDLLIADIDPGQVDDWRKTLPVLANRRY